MYVCMYVCMYFFLEGSFPASRWLIGRSLCRPRLLVVRHGLLVRSSPLALALPHPFPRSGSLFLDFPPLNLLVRVAPLMGCGWVSWPVQWLPANLRSEREYGGGVRPRLVWCLPPCVHLHVVPLQRIELELLGSRR